MLAQRDEALERLGVPGERDEIAAQRRVSAQRGATRGVDPGDHGPRAVIRKIPKRGAEPPAFLGGGRVVGRVLRAQTQPQKLGVGAHARRVGRQAGETLGEVGDGRATSNRSRERADLALGALDAAGEAPQVGELNVGFGGRDRAIAGEPALENFRRKEMFFRAVSRVEEARTQPCVGGPERVEQATRRGHEERRFVAERRERRAQGLAEKRRGIGR